MVGNAIHSVRRAPEARWLFPALVVASAFVAGCGVLPRSTEAGGPASATLAAVEPPTSGPPASEAATPAPSDASSTGGRVTNEEMGFCFGYPQGFTQQGGGGFVEVVGPFSGTGAQPGLGWVEVTDAQGRTAADVANQEVNAVGGLNPGRSTTMLGGERAVVLDGMPGQDAVRKVYAVHGGRLFTLSFAPYRSENTTANDQMEMLYAAVTSSWEWTAPGGTCAESASP